MSSKVNQSAASHGAAEPPAKDSSPNAPGAAKHSPVKKRSLGWQGRRQERKPGEPLPDPRHELFASEYAVTNNAAAAYRNATGTQAGNPSVLAQKWLNKVNIRERITEVRKETNQRIKKKREDIAEWYCDIIDERIVVRPEQLKASELLNKMKGWNEPEKIDSNVTVVVRIGGSKNAND